MSSTLKADILNTGQLEQEIYDAINFFGCSKGYIASTDPCEAQKEFAHRLANAISSGVSKGVQQYLAQTVKTINKPTLQGGPGPHVHPNEPQYDLNAP